MLNLVLDLIFVKWWGISGAAIATVIAQAVCFACSVFYMVKRYPIFRFKRSEFKPDKSKVSLCLQMGIPAALQQCSVSLGQIAMQRLVNHFGEITMAAFTVGSKIERYAVLPVTSMQLGLSTFTGQNLGAKKMERVKKGLYQSVLMGVIITTCITIPMHIFAEPLAQLFALDGEHLVQAVQYVQFYAPICGVTFAAYLICAGLLQGSGDVMFTTFISLSSLLARIIYAYVMTYRFGAEYTICWTSILLSHIWSFVFAWQRYFSGKWKLKNKAILEAGKA